MERKALQGGADLLKYGIIFMQIQEVNTNGTD